MRDAAAFWERVEQRRGLEDRDGLWESAELLPTDEDLDDPEGYESRRGLLTASEDELDAALRSLLDSESMSEDDAQDSGSSADQDPESGPGSDSDPDSGDSGR